MIKSCDYITAFVLHMIILLYIQVLQVQNLCSALFIIPQEHLFEIIIPAVCSCGEGYIIMKLYLIKEDVYIEKLCLMILIFNIGYNSGGLLSE